MKPLIFTLLLAVAMPLWTSAAEEEAKPKQEKAEPKQEAAEPKKEAAEPKKEAAEPKKEAAEPKKEAAKPKQEPLWMTYEGKKGLPGNGKHIVLLSGDEEYRSEEAMPLLGQILSQRHGFKCSVLFAINPETGLIDPNYQDNIPGTHLLESADMMVLGLRFRDLPDDQMKYVDDFVHSGKPILALRTSTHSFNVKGESSYKHYHWTSKEKWVGGFGREVLGETWISHHGKHKSEGTRGVIEPQAAGHPILNGVEDVFGATDVYGVRNLDMENDATVLMWGAITETLEPESAILSEDPRNSPMMPVVWLRKWVGEKGKVTQAITTTMGSADDLKNEDLRRMLVNSVYWALGLEVPKEADVKPLSEFNPSFYGFQREEGYWQKKGMKPSDFALGKE